MRQEAPCGRSVSARSKVVRAWRRSGGLGLGAWGLVVLIGCAARPGAYRAAIQAADPDERIRGIKAAGDAKDRYAVPLLVDRLEDEDEAVRFFAIIALGKITGQRFGYDFALAPYEQAGAIERWREYVRRRSLTATAPARVGPRVPPRGDGSGGRNGSSATAGWSETVPDEHTAAADTLVEGSTQ
jgi:hypothetical protein